MAKSAVKSVFSLHPFPVISHPKPPFFVRFGLIWGKNRLFRGVFLFSSREILARNLILRRKNQFDEAFLLAIRPKYDFCRRRKEESRRFFSSNHRRNNIKTRKVLPKYKHKDEKTQGHHGKAKGQNQKANVLHGKDQAQASKRNCFSPPPPLHSKIQADFLSKLLHFSRLPPLFLSKPPYPTQIPIRSYAQDTRLRVYTRSRSQRISHFCLHPSPHRATNCISAD